MFLEIADWYLCMMYRLFHCRKYGHYSKYDIDYCLNCRKNLPPEKPL